VSAAVRHERRLLLAAHPLAYPLLRLVARAGPAVRVPGVGVVVNDAELARRVLADTASFRKDGPGSSGALWTPVLGPSVLLNMEGDGHRALRRKLAGLFTPPAVERLCAAALSPLLERVRVELAAGREVDLVDVTRVAAGAVVCELLGIRVPPGPAAEARHRRMFAAGERVVAMVGLTTRRLRPGQVAAARAVLAEATAEAGAAWDAGAQATVPGRMRALGLTRDEAVGAAGAFFLTGTETVASLVPRLVALLDDAGRLDAVAADRSLLPAALDEALRMTTPSPAMLRSVAAPARVGRHSLRPGQRVVIATHSCTRAPGGFDPDRARDAAGGLWFGAGQHYCIGAGLAKAEAAAVVGAVLDAAPLRVVGRRAARGVLIPTYRRLVVRRAR
jgi:cytochrome P450